MHRAHVAGHVATDAAVERIADDRMADRAQMHADLVRAAGMDRDLRQRHRRIEMFGSNDPRHRLAASSRARRHLLSIARIAPDRRVDPSSRLHDAPDERDVFLLDLAIVKLPRELFVRGVVLGDTISPDVPRSRRWTMPGRFSPPMPLRSST